MDQRPTRDMRVASELGGKSGIRGFGARGLRDVRVLGSRSYPKGPKNPIMRYLALG